MRKFQELERMEREQKENNRLEFERQVREKRYQQIQQNMETDINYYNGRDQYINRNNYEDQWYGYHQSNEHYRNYDNYAPSINHRIQNQSLPLDEIYLRQLEQRSLTGTEDREFDFNNFPKNDRREIKWLADDEDEDELYFYSGKKTKSTANNEFKFKEQPETDELYEQQEDYEYNSEDFESLASSSSSWSDTEDEQYLKKNKKNNLVTTAKSKSVNIINSTSNNNNNITNRPKAYAPKFVDIDAPTLIKIPPNPIPVTWAHLIHNPLKYLEKGGEGCTEILTSSILGENWDWLNGSNLKCPIQGIYMRPPFNEEFTPQHWAKFMQKILPVVMEGGYLFIWVEREELADVIRVADRFLSFKYVENLCWIRRSLGNRLLRENGKTALFCKSKLTLLILRRDPKNQCKLRHQRNPDCIFDFVGPGRMPDGRVYDVIETLLDGTKAIGPHLMHLWAGASPTDRLVYQARKHWIRVLEIEVDESDNGNENELDISQKKSVAININSLESENEVVNLVTTEPLNEEQNCDSEGDIETNSFVDQPDYISKNFDAEDNTEHQCIDDEHLIGVRESSNTFDDDFCNFIAAEPIFSYQ